MRLGPHLSGTLPAEALQGPIVFFVGAMAHGADDWADEVVDGKVSLSAYPLSASVTCAKLVGCCLLLRVASGAHSSLPPCSPPAPSDTTPATSRRKRSRSSGACFDRKFAARALVWMWGG